MNDSVIFVGGILVTLVIGPVWLVAAIGIVRDLMKKK